jgi:hypothetical protein
VKENQARRRLIAQRQRGNVIKVARMCLACRFLRPDAQPEPPPAAPLCARGPLIADVALRVDCAEHEPALTGRASVSARMSWP